MNDIDVNSSPARPMSDHGYPRVILSETKVFSGNMERYTKYNIVTAQTGSINRVSQIQSIKPEVMFFWHVSPRAYQNFNSSYCKIGAGMAFESSGTTTQGGPPSRGCSIYAGHWLYKAGSALTQSINSTTTSLSVADASNFQAGQYIVIYNAPAGSFNNAEHAKITAKNNATNTLTLASRGYKSTAQSHSSGSIVAQHVLGQGTDGRNWSYNLSSQSPTDANGKTLPQAMADWHAANISKDRDANPVSVRVDGIQFDADFYDELKDKNSDTNNDGVTDHGLSATGVNWWGEGVEIFYTAMRNRFADKIIVSGNRRARGFNTLNGTQMEAFPAYNRTLPIPTFNDIDAQISRYSFYLHNNKKDPLHTHNLNKTPTTVYPEGHSNTGNSIFRLGLGLTLMDEGYYGHENSATHPDPWYDEFAVNVTPGSASYGVATPSNPNNEAALRANLGWLGNPYGERRRIFDHSAFNINQSLLSSGSFDNNINGWSGLYVNVNRDTSVKKDGSAGIHVSTMTSYQVELNQAKLKGPKVDLVKDTQYSLVFSARSTSEREFTAGVGAQINRFIVGPDWRRFIYTFTAEKTANLPVAFGVGREKQPMWFDSVYLFEGNANVFRRDFENGTVIVNATPSVRTFNLGEDYQRISGTQDPINNGAEVTNVTIDPWDAAILVRREGTNIDQPPPPDSDPPPDPDGDTSQSLIPVLNFILSGD